MAYKTGDTKSRYNNTTITTDQNLTNQPSPKPISTSNRSIQTSPFTRLTADFSRRLLGRLVWTIAPDGRPGRGRPWVDS